MSQLTPEELLANAELAGLARVIKLDRTPDGTIAHLRFEQIIKGEFQGSFANRYWTRFGGAVTVKLHKSRRSPEVEAGQEDWHDRVDRGDRIMIHLRWDPNSEAYRTIASNAIWLAPG